MTGPDKGKAVVLLQMALKRDTDVVLCRNRARKVAAELRFEKQAQVKIATAVSEIARNAFRYATGGRATFQLLTYPLNGASVQALITTVSDQGPGIPNMEEILAGTYRSKTGMGAGIRGAKRLMDRVDIESSQKGTIVDLWQTLPRGAPVASTEVQKIIAGLSESAPQNPLEELTTQNQELVDTLDQINVQSTALEQVNDELRETNRGVVALYDELDTVHRVGQVVASKLDLESLVKAITDATTELSGAEFGACVLLSLKGKFIWQCVSGSLLADLPETSPPLITDVILDEYSDIFRFEADALPQPLAGALGLQSVLICPLRDESRALVGALILGHTRGNVFSERTERILPTVSLQASIGIANAKLYRHVQSADQAKAQFLAVLSHELRTPLNPVFAILTSLEENPNLPEDARRDLVVMRRNLRLEATLIDDLLDLTKISEGKMVLKMEPLDLHAILGSVLHTCNEEIVRKKTRVTRELSAKSHHIMGDEVRLQQALWNLVNNAVKFTPEGGALAVETVNDGAGNIVASVSDSGKGIEASALERIFSAFEQEDQLVGARFGGLGLGLAISKGIVDAHGGLIVAESEGNNQGARFRITLPTVEPPTAITGPAVIPAPAAKAGALRILLVDDHEDTRVVMSQVLKMRGYLISGAGSVAEALAVFASAEFDMVISDLGLPDGSGHELMIEMQKIRPVKGIALSGYGMESDLERSRQAGFSRHFIKPIDFPKLDAAIVELAQES